MTYSASQIIAISGFHQNLGLQVSQDLQDRISDLQSVLVLAGKLRRMVTHPNATTNVKNLLRNSIPGISLVAPTAYVLVPTVGKITLPTGFGLYDITGDLLDLANSYFDNGVSGYLSILGSATSSCRVSREVLGSLYAFESEGFTGIAPDVKNHVDLVTGGITSKFGPLAVGSQDNLRASGLYTGGSSISTSAADIRRSINAVADAISGLGTLYDFQSLASVGTPYGLVLSLLSQGLIKTEFLESFSEQNVDVNALDQVNEGILISILEKISGSELLKIISGTGLQVPTGSILQTAADLLKTDKIINVSAINAIPGGTLKDLASKLISLKVNFETKEDLIAALRDIEIIDTPDLANLSDPVPRLDINIIRSAFPSGSGDFGSPYIQEVVGTPSGYTHTAALVTIFRVVSSISSSAEALAVADAADAVYAKYVANASATSEEAALTIAVNNLVAVAAFESLFVEADDAISDIIDQVNLELENQERMGLDLAINIPGAVAIGQLCALLPSLGADSFNSGATPMLLDMLTDDIYGQATRAVLLQGSNEQILKTIGKETIGISDIEKVALGVRALAGEGLTPQQRENVIEDARARNLDVNNALANAVFYGYNNQYYVSRGFPSA